MTETTLWLLAFVGLYCAFLLYWGLAAARLGQDPKSYFLADRNLPAWVVVAAATGIAINGWIFLGHPDIIYRDGFPFAHTALGAIIMALGSAFFLKRQWMLGKRYGYVTPGEMAGHYFGGEVIRLAIAAVALVFAVPFVAMQLGISGLIVADLTNGVVDPRIAMWILTIVLFAYACFGGMRAVAYAATFQGVLMMAGLAGIGLYAYGLVGGFGDFASALAMASRVDPAATAAPALPLSLLRIPGMMQFTAGWGVEEPAGGIWTAALIFSYCVALMGLTINPAFSLMAFSSRSPKGFAAQATWAVAGAAGALLVLLPVAQGMVPRLLELPAGATGLAQGHGQLAMSGGSIVSSYIAALGSTAPWFAAIFAVCAIAAIQAIAAFAASATSTLLLRDIYRRYIEPDLDLERQRLYARIGVGLILLVALAMACFSPSAVVALGALALGFGAQLLPVLAGICWISWITRPAATVGLVFGLAFVLFTENFGIALAGFFGLDLPWGRWPWTIHSALWGLFANIAAVLVISLISQGAEDKAHRQSFHAFLRSHAALPVSRHYLRHVAWAAALAWLFFAIGPGAVIGNSFFGDPAGGLDAWVLGVPPLWAWQILWWALGVVLVWFLAYRMGMATVPSRFITLATKAERAVPPPSLTGERFVMRWFWIVVLAAAAVVLVKWMFGP